MIGKTQMRWVLLGCAAMGALAACTGADGVASPGEGAFINPSPPPPPPPPPPPGPPTGPAADCPAGFINVGVIANLRNCQLPNLITGNFQIQNVANTIYSISGRVNVGVDRGPNPASPNASGQQGILTIAPGVRIFGSGGLDYLVVNRGSQIFAQGNASSPIIMTSRQSVEGATGIDSIGQWGGLVVLGRAPTAACPTGVTAPNLSCEAQVEGTNAFYGGVTDNDDSGIIRFVRVQHSGFEILPNNELNGITFAGVGSGTTVENVQVHNSSDDGIEIFGGTLNLRNIVLTGNDDDSFDVDTGWRGATQYLVALQRANGGDRGFEFSAAGDAGFFTVPRISNATIVARSGGGDAIVINSGNSLRLSNSVVHDVNGACLDIDGTNTVTNAPEFRSVVMTCAIPFRDDTDVNGAATLALFNPTGVTTNNRTGLASTLTNGIVNGANETTTVTNVQGAIPPTTPPARPAGLQSPFLQNPTFIGAVPNAADTRFVGWTCGILAEEAC